MKSLSSHLVTFVLLLSIADVPTQFTPKTRDQQDGAGGMVVRLKDWSRFFAVAQGYKLPRLATAYSKQLTQAD